MNFEQDIRQHTLACLPHGPTDRLALDAKSTSDLLILYLSWCNRFISDRPRRVHLSGLISAKWPTIDPSYKAALDCIVSRFERGSNLNAHLSRGVNTSFQSPAANTARRLRHQRHLDLLLNDWGVHHLHLSLEVQTDGFVKRTRSLLFVAVRPDDAYLIDVVDHGPDAWTKQHILETMIEEWPDASLMIEARGVLPSGKRLSDTQRRNLRSNGYNASFEIDGRVYMSPMGGIMSTGASLLTTMVARQILAQSKIVEAALSKRLVEHRIFLPFDPDFHFVFFENGYGVLEKRTRTVIRFA